MKLRIISKGSVTDGLGHVFRSQSFMRRAAREHEVEVCTVIDQGLAHILRDCECSNLVFPDMHGLERHLEKSVDVDATVFDMMTISKRALEFSRGRSSILASISPVFDKMADMDMFFTRFPGDSVQGKTRVFSGPEYTIYGFNCMPIRDDVYDRTLAQGVPSVALSLGGADALNKTAQILSEMIRYPDPLLIWVLLGEGYSHSHDRLVEMVKSQHRHEIVLARTGNSMWRILGNCGFAVLAGGVTTMEAMYAGLPTINVFDDGSKAKSMDHYFRSGATLDGGTYATLEEIFAPRFAALCRDTRWLLEIRRNCAGLGLDDLGARRILLHIEDALGEPTPARTESHEVAA